MRSRDRLNVVTALLSASVAACVAFGCAAGARADDDARATAMALDREGRRADDEADPARALESYRALVALSPRTAFHDHAERRVAWIEARRDGGHTALAAWMAITRVPAAELTIARVRKFERQTRLFAPGLVRRESRAFIAHAWLHRFHRPEEALVAYEAWMIEPGSGPSEVQRAAWGAAQSRVAMGRARVALDRWDELGIPPNDQRAWLVVAAVAETGRPIAWASLALSLIVAGVIGWLLLVGASARRARAIAYVVLAASLVIVAIAAGFLVSDRLGVLSRWVA